MKKSEGLQAIEKPLASLPHAIGKHIFDHIQKLTHYEPVIGIMGKTGAGKSSLCNALFQSEVTPISDISACTRDVLRFRLCSVHHSLILVDLPGVGESEQRDKEYESLYRRILPRLDLILWVIKADDRAFSVDERFYKRVMTDHQHRTLFIVNQADKIEPSHEWNVTGNAPSPDQSVNIEAAGVHSSAIFTTPSCMRCLSENRMESPINGRNGNALPAGSCHQPIGGTTA